MIKRLTTFIVAVFFICSTSMANQEYNITLEKGEPQGRTIELPYGNISFKLEEYGSHHRVLVSIDNTTVNQALLLFKNSQDEKSLKKNKPKIEFERTYPGSKGKRSVFGCRELNQAFISVIPQDKSDLFGIDVSSTSITKLELPMYLAKYDPKKLIKKGAYNINYKILSEEILTFNIEVKGWSENDPDYLSTKKAVEDYIRSVDTAAFCKNRRHKPSLSEQQRPYQERKDSLINVITSTLQQSEWISVDKPHQKYSELLAQLNKVNLNEHTYDCGGHKRVSKPHSCSYCSLSSQQVYHQLDDLYQQLRNGKITKDIAVKKAQALYTCYQKNGKRKKEASYSDKIAKFYSRITSF